MAGTLKGEMKIKEEIEEEILLSSTVDNICTVKKTCTVKNTCTVMDTCSVKDACTVEDTCTKEKTCVVYIKEEDVKCEITETQGNTYNLNFLNDAFLFQK